MTKPEKTSRKQPKWVSAPDFMAYADHQMKQEKQSPDVVVGRAKKLGLFDHEDIPCTTTLYTYIDLCLIEKRPDIVNKRERFGDWEIDTVNGLQGKGDQALLTLTERKTRYEVIIKMGGKFKSIKEIMVEQIGS